MGDVASVMTSPVCVQISKREVSLPSIPDAVYTGNEIHPEIYDTGAYTVEKNVYTLTGVYPIKITLRDSENYAFVGHSDPYAYVDFVINSAQNYFIDELRINDIFTSNAPLPYALSRFGQVEFRYSASADGVFSPNTPINAGEYYVKAFVSATDCYSGLESDPVKFTVIEELVSGIAINTYPDLLKYKAFDKLNKDGLSVRVSYNSGRSETVFEDDIDVKYMSEDSFRYGDRGVILSYCGASVILLVDVGKADYDISDIIFPNSSAVYNGKIQCPSFSPSLPVGKDGIPLSVTVTGGGIDVGTYQAALVFSTESKNYNLPEPIYSEFSITPCAATVSWGQLEFVYDGTPKLPSAFYIDVEGRRVELCPIGERSNAGEYEAVAELVNPNYYLVNPTVKFTVHKARYDMSGIVWQGGNERYDGEKKKVVLTNLPDGVYVVGYVNASGVDCGKYVATATLAYDEKNYEQPIIASYEWEIILGEYDLSGFDFLDNVAIYSGEKNYPILSGKMPVGSDGIMLQYSFLGYATNVSDGEVSVEISFYTESTNYQAPPSISRNVTVTPKGITVNWHSLYCVYTGQINLPYAESEFCSATVTGGERDAGEYFANATADDLNYYVINSVVEYTVSPAVNGWKSSPTISNIFLGDKLSPFAEALGGEVIFKYYSDEVCTEQLSEAPDTVGVYYMIAESSGGRNYLPISSPPIKFEIIAVVPIGIEIQLKRTDYTAFDVIDTADFIAYLCHNNGKKTELSTDSVEVCYKGGSYLIYGDSAAEFKYGDFSCDCELTVVKRSFDLSGVIWCDTVAVYDGTQKNAYLSGLPEGLKVVAYHGNGHVNAGKYTVSAEFEYDTHNYLPPEIDNATLTVKKQTVPTPIIQSAEYDGTQKSPILPTDIRYTHTFSFSALHSGSYGVSFVLVDTNNYCFDNGAGNITVDFVVMPRRVEISLSDVDFYLFDKESEIKSSWNIVAGSVIPGDDLCLRFFTEGNKLMAVSDNADYDVSVIPGGINRHSFPSAYVISSVFLVFSFILIIALLVALIIINRRRISARLVAYNSNNGNTDVLYAPAVDNSAEEKEECEILDTPDDAKHENKLTESDSAMAVSVDYAETAITNSLAKDLIRRDEDVLTKGNKHGIVNVDTLSRSFEAGDRVDINALKSKSLIPYDTGYIKVLARGIIDKPLYVYANDFSLAAVKMIALTGGKAIKVNTAQKNKGHKGR